MSSKSMHWFLGVLCRMLSKNKAKNMIVSEMASSSYTNSANSFITEPFAGHTHVVLKASAATTPLSLSKLQVLTKIPRESVDQKEIVWYYHRSCMPKTLQWSKAIQLFFWRERMVERMCGNANRFPNAWFWNRSWKRKRVKLWGHMTRRPKSCPQHQVAFATRTVIPSAKDCRKKKG